MAVGLSLFSASAQPFEARVEAPNFTISIPDFPQFVVGPHPNAPMQPSARLFGAAGNGLTLSVLTPTAEASTSASQCASWLAGTVLSRFAPDLGSVQIIQAGENAYVLVFPLKIGPLEQLKAFVVSGNGKGHCLETHISRIGATEQERQQWLAGFRNVRVVAQ